MARKRRRKKLNLEILSERATEWIGSTASIVVHTLLFVGIFALRLFGIGFEQILLVLTTAVSLEAIYLAIFIQMTVNKNTESLEEVEVDIDKLQEDMDDIEVEIKDMGDDIEHIHEEEKADEIHERQIQATMDTIQATLQKLTSEMEKLEQRRIVLRKTRTKKRGAV